MSRLEELSKIIQNLDPYSQERDAFETIVMGESMQLQFDSDGRVSLPSNLTAQVEIDSKACFVGKGLVFEVWSPENFSKHLQSAKEIAKDNRQVLKNNVQV